MPPLNRCDLSKISIPNDRHYISIAQQYVSSVSEMIGFGPQELEDIRSAVHIAIDIVFSHSFEPDEQAMLEITCERVPEGLKILLHDHGKPFDVAVQETGASPAYAATNPSLQFFQLHTYMDEVLIKNLGPDGKMISLIKYHKNSPITEYYAACDLEPYSAQLPAQKGLKATQPIQIRQMRPSEAAAVSKAIYKSYGYSYPYEYVYYPEKLIELNQTQKLHSAVAVASDGQIAGHCALYRPTDQHQIAEMVQGVVKPEFRCQGCFAKLTAYLLAVARTQSLTGVFAQPVTNHTYSQHAGHGFGLRDCALLLGQIPAGTQFKGIAINTDQRISVLVQFKYLQPPRSGAVFAPPHHQHMLDRIYRHLGTVPDFRAPVQSEGPAADRRSRFKVTVKKPLKLTSIELTDIGPDAVDQIHRKVRKLRQEAVEVVNLYVDLSDPAAYTTISELEQLGFFFAGLLPNALDGRDALILQHPIDLSLEYDQIQLESKMALSLANYIRQWDPNWT